MSFLDPNVLPGFREAVEKERALRDLSLMDTVPICGLSCRQLSLRMWVLLRECGNALVLGGMPSPEEIAVFLWFLSPDYCLEEKKRQKFVRSKVAPALKSLGLIGCIREIRAHMDHAFLDSPGGSGSERKEYVTPAVSIIDFLASEYGWTDSHIMDLPLERLFLYQRAAILRRNPKALLTNESDGIISRHLRERMGIPN